VRPILSQTRLFILGFALILIANVIALVGVAVNRSGKPEAVIELTERELKLPYDTSDENSGLALDLRWRVIQESHDGIYPLYPTWGPWVAPVWFDGKKLTEIGFIIDETTCPDEHSKRKERLPKDAFIVLEYDGEQYQVALRRAEMEVKKAQADLKGNKKDKKLQENYEQAQIDLEGEKIWASRLFAIDVGLDAGRLRERYPDRSKFIIMGGIVELECRFYKNRKEVAGHISYIRIGKINVPLEYRKVFDPILLQGHYSRDSRYKVELAYGSRFEPWIQRIDKLLK
jgi:hypothetical protein